VPSIRRYPMDSRTLVIVSGAISTDWRPRGFTFVRDGRRDRLSISIGRDRVRRVERVCQALLSTAPTPPLSDEDLVG